MGVLSDPSIEGRLDESPIERCCYGTTAALARRCSRSRRVANQGRLGTSKPSNFYTGLKFSSKKNFYGRVAADANFSDLFSALLRPHSGRREF